MDPVLIERFAEIEGARPVIDEASVSLVREDVRRVAGGLGFDTKGVGELAIAVSELATNQLRHARLGKIAVRAIEREGVPGVEVAAGDRGTGIFDPKTALAGVPRHHGSLGTGLSSVLRMCDEVDFDVRLGEGTAIYARKFRQPVARRPVVAILARPHPDETRSGDDAWFVRDDHSLRLVLADGLGHGPLAREAARTFIQHVVDKGGDASGLIESAHEVLASTRGAVGAICDIDELGRTATTSALGNVIVQVVGARASTGPSGVIGGTSPRRRPSVETVPLRGRGMVVAFTDGLSSRLELDVRDDVALEHPLTIAHHLLEKFGRDNDDATVIVVG